MAGQSRHGVSQCTGGNQIHMVGQEFLYHEAALCETTERSLGMEAEVSGLVFSL